MSKHDGIRHYVVSTVERASGGLADVSFVGTDVGRANAVLADRAQGWGVAYRLDVDADGTVEVVKRVRIDFDPPVPPQVQRIADELQAQLAAVTS